MAPDPRYLERREKAWALRGQGWTLERIGLEMKVSRERVRQMIAQRAQELGLMKPGEYAAWSRRNRQARALALELAEPD